MLEYSAIDAPLAQPRNLLLGHLLSTVIGIGISKLFQLNPNSESLFWIAGPLACATATMVMSLTKTVHPPGGATALLACVDPNTRHLGWFLLPVVLLSCALMLTVSLLINNIQRRFPIYWWTPSSLQRQEPDREKDAEQPSSTIRNDGQSGATTQSENWIDQELKIRRGHILVPNSLSLTTDDMQFLEALSKRI